VGRNMCAVTELDIFNMKKIFILNPPGFLLLAMMMWLLEYALCSLFSLFNYLTLNVISCFVFRRLTPSYAEGDLVFVIRYVWLFHWIHKNSFNHPHTTLVNADMKIKNLEEHPVFHLSNIQKLCSILLQRFHLLPPFLEFAF